MDEPNRAGSSADAMDDDTLDPAALAETFSDDPTYNMQFDEDEKEEDVAAMFADDAEEELVMALTKMWQDVCLR